MVGITGGFALSDYRSRSVVIDVAGMANQSISRVSNYQVKVPFSQMSATIHNIVCQGGKVTNVAVQSLPSLNVGQSSAESEKMADDKRTAAKEQNSGSRSSGRKGGRAKK